MKFLTKFSALALLATAVLGGMTACGDDDPDPKGQTGTLSIQIGETTYDSVTFTLSSSEQPAPTMYAYLAAAQGTTMTADQVFDQGTRQSATSGTFTLKALDEDSAYTLYAVSMGEAGLSAVASADFTTPANEWGPATARSMGVQINKVTETGVNVTYMLGKEATLGMVAVWPRVVLENYVYETLKLDESGTLTEGDIVVGLLVDTGYGQFVSGDETLNWGEELWPDADYVFMTVGMIDEDTPGDAQLTHFTTKAFPLQGDPTVEISVTDKNYMKAYFHYEINKDVYTYLRFVTTKSEIDEYIAHFGEEDLREFVRFSDPMWEYIDQTQSKTESINFGWEAGGQWFTALAVAADENLSISKKLARADVQLPEQPEGTEPATYSCHATNIAATNCDVHFDLDDNCWRVFFRVIPPAAYQKELGDYGELIYSRVLWEEGWCYYREGNTPESPVANNDDIFMDLAPDTEYVIVATALNWDGMLSGVTASEPFRTKALTYENSTAEVSIEMDNIDKYSARAIYHANDKTRVLYHAILEKASASQAGSTDSEIIGYLMSYGNAWAMVDFEESPDYRPELGGQVWTWAGMDPNTEYVYYYCAEDVNGAITGLGRTGFTTLPVTSGPNPDVTISVYDITSTGCTVDIVMNSDVRDFLYLTVEEELLNYDPETGTQEELAQAVYDYVLQQGLKGTSSKRNEVLTKLNPGKNYYTGAIAYGSGTAEKFRYDKFTTLPRERNAVMRNMTLTLDPTRIYALPGGAARDWDALRQNNLKAVDRSGAKEGTLSQVEDGKNSMDVLLQEGYTPISLKNAYKSMTKWR